MLENIENALRHRGELRIEESKYNTNFIACIDILGIFPNAPSLKTLSEMYPEFPYARGETLDDALKNLDKRAALWNRLTSDAQDKLILDFVSYKCSKIFNIVNNENPC